MSRYPLCAILSAALTVCLLTQTALAQVTPAQSQSTDDIVRINTELVQTGVTVFDKQGRFVDGLKKEHFEVRIANRLVPISFFENIVAGSTKDRLTKLASKNDSVPVASQPSYRQRTIVFFIDDRHLSLDSVGRTRRMLNDFIDKQMSQNDMVGIASASGQIGFLQQFTDNKDVLRAATARLNHVPYTVSDYGKNPGAPMTEYMALAIERREDTNVSEFFIQDCLKWVPKGPTRVERASMRRHCEIEVQNRARQVLVQAGSVTSATYSSLDTLLQTAARMPGSKLAFFVSDGFLADTGPRGQVGSDQVGQLTDQARRAGVVIYTIDARGLTSGALDATGNVPLDPNGALQNANMREIFATQDALNALAVDTGGRALRNQNYFGQFITEALVETSRYYLIAWRPEANETTTEKIKKIKVSVIGRPDLIVRAARNVFTNAAFASTGDKESSTKATADSDLKAALTDSLPIQRLPLHLSLIYLNTPDNGMVLTSSVQAPAELLSYGDRNDEPAKLSLAGVVLDEQGKAIGGFKTGLKVNPSTQRASDASPSTVIYNHRFQLKPGMYQVRVAGRDEQSGTVGSTMQWIVIPDLSTKQLQLSSLILGLENVANKNSGDSVQWSVEKKFSPNTQLRFMTFIYNGGPATSRQLTVQVKIYKEGQAVVSTPLKVVVRETQSDPERIPLEREISLKSLSGGRYILEVNVTDPRNRQTASQQTAFYIQ